MTWPQISLATRRRPSRPGLGSVNLRTFTGCWVLGGVELLLVLSQLRHAPTRARTRAHTHAHAHLLTLFSLLLQYGEAKRAIVATPDR